MHSTNAFYMVNIIQIKFSNLTLMIYVIMASTIYIIIFNFTDFIMKFYLPIVLINPYFTTNIIVLI